VLPRLPHGWAAIGRASSFRTSREACTGALMSAGVTSTRLPSRSRAADFGGRGSRGGSVSVSLYDRAGTRSQCPSHASPRAIRFIGHSKAPAGERSRRSARRGDWRRATPQGGGARKTHQRATATRQDRFYLLQWLPRGRAWSNPIQQLGQTANTRAGYRDQCVPRGCSGRGKTFARRRIEPIAIPIPARLLVPSRRRLRHRERPRRPWLCRQQLDRRLLGRRRRRDPEQLGERRGISAAKLQLPREAWLLQEERLQDLCDPLDRRALCRDRLDRRWLWRSWRLRLIDAPSSSPQFGNAVGGACHGVVIPSVICRRVAVSPLRCRSSGGSARPFEIECLTTPYDGCVL
jgi:hypothetical protein